MSALVDIDHVVRRFDVEVSEPRLLDDVKRELQAPDWGDHPPEIKQVGASLLEVRLEGHDAAISKLVRAVERTRGVRIHQDRVRRARATRKPQIAPNVPPGQLGAGAKPTVVAVVDSGIMVEHRDLKSHLWKGHSSDGKEWTHGARCIGGTLSSDIADHNGHGTRLAGTILDAAAGASDVRLMAVKFFDPDSLPGPDNGAAAIDFATTAEPKADIINLSWDLGMGSSKLEEAINNACKAGILVVIAAGNSGADNDVTPAIPARYRELCPEQIITVMATNLYNEKASFSNYGVKKVDLAAPGVEILATRASMSTASEDELDRTGFYDEYRTYSGTSAAAAFVSGMAAWLKDQHGWKAVQLKEKLCEAAKRNRSRNLQSKCITGGALGLSDLSLIS
jgi:subtilisin family serine protease